ncbi:unnamed protein product [Prunus armeniaca]|uniref:Uncharacterized protein n=1 Tax=Prunus armeniaca TaxID=36596 RepID=A0A6J5YCX2_PRUAR|nr:unnamed protein product [Prunus armeniaca]
MPLKLTKFLIYLKMGIFSAQFAYAVALIVAASLCLIEANQTAIGMKWKQRAERVRLLQLGLQWPGTFANAPAIVVHPMLAAEDGLWPDYNDGTWPACCTQKSFDEKEKVLNEAGYVPSNTEKYPLGGIVSAIQNAFRTTPSCFAKKVLWRNFIYASTRISSLGIVRWIYSPNGGYYSSSSCPDYVRIPAYASMGDLGHIFGLAVVKRKFQVPDADVL